MTEYRFVTTWVVDAPVERVYDAIDDAARWPEWWRGVRRAVLLEDGDERGVGRLWAFTWRSCARGAPGVRLEPRRGHAVGRRGLARRLGAELVARS